MIRVVWMSLGLAGIFAFLMLHFSSADVSVAAQSIATQEQSQHTQHPEQFSVLAERLSEFGLQLLQLKETEELPEYFLAITAQGVFYLAKDGASLIQGTVFSLEEPIGDMTEASMMIVRHELLAQHQQLVLSFRAPKEKYRVTVFTDHTCPYCRQMHEEMDAYHALGISIDYLAYPRAGLEDATAMTLNQIFCSSQPQQAMNQAMRGEMVSALALCDFVMEQHYQLGMQVGVTGTPAIITASGRLLPGYVPPERLILELQQE